MKKSIVAVLAIASLSGCATVRKERARQEMNHEVYIAVENARINKEPSCILGGKINNAIEKYNAAK